MNFSLGFHVKGPSTKNIQVQLGGGGGDGTDEIGQIRTQWERVVSNTLLLNTHSGMAIRVFQTTK